jgi:replicative DNA helicase
MDRVPPHDNEIEKAYLCCCFIDPTVIGEAEEEDFYSPAHRHIYGALIELRFKGLAPELLTVKAELESMGKLDEAHGEAYIAEVIKAVPSSANAEFYAGTIRGHALRRRIISIAGELSHSAYDGILKERVIIVSAAQELISLLR